MPARSAPSPVAAHVVLRDRQLAALATVEDVAERPPVVDDVVGPLGVVGDDRAVFVEHPARYISAIRSMMPDPYSPLTPVAATAWRTPARRSTDPPRSP